jgi:hypothetical protein
MTAKRPWRLCESIEALEIAAAYPIIIKKLLAESILDHDLRHASQPAERTVVAAAGMSLS